MGADKKSIFGWLRTASEVPAFILFFAFTITETTTYNFAIFRSCYVDFGYDKSICEELGTGNANNYTEQIEEEVQPYANMILMVQEMITQVAPAMIVLVLGPWSDQHGRRPVLIVNMIGFCLGGIVAIIVASIESLSAWYFMGCSLLIALFGGVTPFLTAIICYISDITTEKNRGFRMGVFEGVMAAGTLIGTVLTSYIFALGGYITIYSLATVCFFLAFFFNLFVMVESRQFAENKTVRTNICSPKNFKDMVHTVFKKRENGLTLAVILIMITSTIARFIGHADVSVFYLFLRKKLDWDMEKYTLYKTFRDLLRIIVTVIGITILHKKMRIREAPLILVSAALTFASMLLQAWASADWHIYVAGVIRSLGGILAPMIRSLLSKMVTQEETGKLFSVTVALESLVLLGGIPLYTLVYNNTLDTEPGAFNFITGALYFLLVICIGIVLVVQKFLVKENIFLEDQKEPILDKKVSNEISNQA
ncbi:Major Facilitator Superfamily [Popillia japonica]|uniref:Major Facilitator Superfamily n=1 Tax=Popillia japonica TaxID=7064 RepID=A0AAW1JZM8_POPJA